MNYELAKELRDKGFIYRNHLHRAYKEDGTFRTIGEENNGNYVLEPTLSELIEACGEAFLCVQKGQDPSYTPNEKSDGLWRAWATKEEWIKLARQDFPALEGFSTSEEAVARLWLALNKK